MEWIKENIEWISPIIVALLGLIGVMISHFVKKGKSGNSNKMKQKSGNNSTNIQIGGDYNGR
jgi:hypothetical protein